jgi:hypothetical protein
MKPTMTIRQMLMPILLRDSLLGGPLGYAVTELIDAHPAEAAKTTAAEGAHKMARALEPVSVFISRKAHLCRRSNARPDLQPLARKAATIGRLRFELIGLSLTLGHPG